MYDTRNRFWKNKALAQADTHSREAENRVSLDLLDSADETKDDDGRE